ncbi:MAG: hypothetical protein ACEQSR_16625 [Candidatus Methylacidiphilales bacterium]
MKNQINTLLLFLVLVFSCKKQANQETTTIKPACDCNTITSPTKQLSLASSIIIGDWTWVYTETIGRGITKTYQTPQNTNKTITYQFTSDSLIIKENGVKTYSNKYAVGYFGDLNKTPTDTDLVVKYLTSDTITGVSLLFLDKNCMLLVNSYDDAGGNTLLKRK